MPKKSMENLTESMLYVLMAFHCRPMCGIEVAAFLDTLTKGRVQMGPATLYTILGKFEKEHYLQEIHVEAVSYTHLLTFTWDETVLDQLVKDSYSAAYGARNLRRHIQKSLEDPIATKIIESYLHPITALKAVVENGTIVIHAL